MKYIYLLFLYLFTNILFAQEVNDSTIIKGYLDSGTSYFLSSDDFDLGQSKVVEKDEKIFLYGFNERLPLLEGYINNKNVFFLPSTIIWNNKKEKEYLISKKGNKLLRKQILESYLGNSNKSNDVKEIQESSLDTIKYFFLLLKSKDNYVHSEISTYCNGTGKSDYIDNGVYAIMDFYECKDYNNLTKRFIKIASKGNPYFIEYKTDFQFYTKGQQKVSYIEAKDYIDNLDYIQGKALDKLLLDHSYQSYLPHLVKIEDKVNFAREKGVAVLDYNAIESEYYGTGAKFKVLNFSDKPIKKIYVTFYGTNKNKQKVYLSKDKLNVTKLLTELLEPYNTIEIEFDKIWNTNSVEYLTIKSFKIIYLDDKEVTIPFNDNLYISEDKMNEYLDFLKKD
ncbi:hypothetical protein OBK03_13810 [Empedobacter falsenii]